MVCHGMLWYICFAAVNQILSELPKCTLWRWLTVMSILVYDPLSTTKLQANIRFIIYRKYLRNVHRHYIHYEIRNRFIF